MGLQHVEHALVHLMFDEAVRARFVAQGVDALAPFDLDASERALFAQVNVAGLLLDAEERTAILHARFARSMPMALAALSACDAQLRAFVAATTPALLRLPPHHRVVRVQAAVVRELAHRLPQHLPAPTTTAVLAACQFEATIVKNAEALRDHATTMPHAHPSAPVAFDEARPLSMGDFVVAAMLWAPLAVVRTALVGRDDPNLFLSLQQTPVAATALVSRVAQAQAQQQQRLCLCQAEVTHNAGVEVDVTTNVLELNPGFASVVAAAQRGLSFGAIRTALSQTGANDVLLDGIADTTRDLVARGMLAMR